MLALEPTIKERLETLPALSGWVVSGITVPEGSGADRQLTLRVGTVQVGDAKAMATSVSPSWEMRLSVPRGAAAALELDAAFAAILASFHGWFPGDVTGRIWERMALGAVGEISQSLGEGRAGISLSFATSAKFDGVDE